MFGNSPTRYDLDEVVWVKSIKAPGQIVGIINEADEIKFRIRYVDFVDEQFDSASDEPCKEITHYVTRTFKRKDIRKA